MIKLKCSNHLSIFVYRLNKEENEMVWNEEDHPRSDDGKFAPKDGGGNSNKENTTQELFRDSRLQREIEANKLKRKNELLDILGDKATHADVLYGSEETLKEKIAEYGLGDKLRKIELNNSSSGKSLKQKGAEFALGKGYGEIAYKIGDSKYGPDTMGMIDLAHDKKINQNYIKDAIELKNYNDPRIASDREYLTEKIKEQFRDYGFKTDEIKGYFFKRNSEPSIRMSQDKDFRKMIKENKEKLKKGIEFNAKFPCYKSGKESNWHYALGHYDIRNSFIDEGGNLRLKVYDTYDFNKTNKTPMNKAGRNEMLKGNLKPYFSIHDIIIPKNELDKIWNN